MGKIIDFPQKPNNKGKKRDTKKLITLLTVCGAVVTITGISIADVVGLLRNKEMDKSKFESDKEFSEDRTENFTPTPNPTSTLELDWQSKAEEYNNKGLDLYNSGYYEEAIEMYDNAIALEKQGIEDIDICYYNRGRAYYKLGNYEKAVGDFTISIEIKPHAKYYSNRAEAYRALGDHANASLDDSKAILNAFE